MLKDSEVPVLGARLGLAWIWLYAMVTWLPRMAGNLPNYPMWFQRLEDNWQRRFDLA